MLFSECIQFVNMNPIMILFHHDKEMEKNTHSYIKFKLQYQSHQTLLCSLFFFKYDYKVNVYYKIIKITYVYVIILQKLMSTALKLKNGNNSYLPWKALKN